jgi:hypothetical protein
MKQEQRSMKGEEHIVPTRSIHPIEFLTPFDPVRCTIADEIGIAGPVFRGLGQFVPNGDFQLLTVAVRRAATTLETAFL